MTTRASGRPRTSETRDLRENLLRTSRELLDEGGPAALSMREVARRAGCTHQAPYHYFTNREAILAALVEAGFDELANRLREARDKVGTEDLRAVAEASGNAYVEFALTATCATLRGSPRFWRPVSGPATSSADSRRSLLVSAPPPSRRPPCGQASTGWRSCFSTVSWQMNSRPWRIGWPTRDG